MRGWNTRRKISKHTHTLSRLNLANHWRDMGLRHWQDIVGSLLPTSHVGGWNTRRKISKQTHTLSRLNLANHWRDMGLRHWQDIVGSLLPTSHVYPELRYWISHPLILAIQDRNNPCVLIAITPYILHGPELPHIKGGWNTRRKISKQTHTLSRLNLANHWRDMGLRHWQDIVGALLPTSHRSPRISCTDPNYHTLSVLEMALREFLHYTASTVGRQPASD
eukprot:sb/3469800/